MLKAKEIKVLTAQDPAELESSLNRLLSGQDSWTLHGPLVVNDSCGKLNYCQALVRLVPFEVPGMGAVMPAGAPLIMPRG